MLTDKFAEFSSDAVSGLERGADALLYVMTHGHTLTVPTDALLFAEKVVVISIARHEGESPVVIADVNRAIDLIAATLRIRARLDAEPAGARTPSREPAEVAGGHAVKRIAPVPTRPPGGATAVPRVEADAAMTF